MSALNSYQWPGNIRELQNLVERAVILSNDGMLPNPLPTTGTQPVYRLDSCNYSEGVRALFDSANASGSPLGDRRPEGRSRQAWPEAHYSDPQDAEAGDLPGLGSQTAGM